ncbi:MAG: 16S rRNA (cytidine(1402)-2'-O)-methyltransferase [Alphaproteobacteria bacterium]
MPNPSKPAPKIDLGALPVPAPGLHIVATPIGNLSDITLRALATLAHADIVYCEDTRHSRKLFEHFGLRPRLAAYHEHNAAEKRDEILGALADGKTVALISDAGTPLISDPGFKLVREAVAAGHAVTTEPGPSAAIAALTLAGLPTDRFLFLGFLSPKSAARREEILGVKEVRASLVIYESPQRVGATLIDLAACLGPRPAAIAREITKLHEEVKRGTLAELAAQFAEAETPKGEIVIIVGPPTGEPREEADLDAALTTALARLSLKEAVAQVTAELGVSRRLVYARALALSRKS